MPDKEYQDKKRECWEEFMRSTDKIITPRDAFFYAFDRAYALGKQKKESKSLQQSIALEKEIDAEIDRVQRILQKRQQAPNLF